MPEEEVRRLQDSRGVTVAEPAPLSLFGFAIGTIAIGHVPAGFTAHRAHIGTAPVLLAFSGLPPFLAGMRAYRRGNTCAATAVSCYGANNTVVAVFLLLGAGRLIPTTHGTDEAVAIEMFRCAYVSLVLGAAALRLNAVFVAILRTLVPGFPLTGPALTGEPTIVGRVGGYWLILSALLAFYAAGALVINSAYRRTVLPLFGKA